LTRIVFIVFALATGAAAYAGVAGWGGENEQIANSIRSGSGGRVGYIGGVK
jgi:hypothetical protein